MCVAEELAKRRRPECPDSFLLAVTRLYTRQRRTPRWLASAPCSTVQQDLRVVQLHRTLGIVHRHRHRQAPLPRSLLATASMLYKNPVNDRRNDLPPREIGEVWWRINDLRRVFPASMMHVCINSRAHYSGKTERYSRGFD